MKVPDVAKVLGCSDRNVWRLIKDGQLSVIKIRGLTRVTRDSLVELLEKGTDS